MAVTWEDLVEKRFRTTKFREGYDQDEVDDFLDEVAVELQRLRTENDGLRSRVAAGPTGDRNGAAGDGNASAVGVVREAQEAAERALAALEARRAALEGEVERLRDVEADCRSRLSAYLEERLRELRDGPRVVAGVDLS